MASAPYDYYSSVETFSKCKKYIGMAVLKTTEARCMCGCNAGKTGYREITLPPNCEEGVERKRKRGREGGR